MQFGLIAAFGGGVLGAAFGALPAFIITGVIAIAGAVVAMGGGADLTVGLVAFGSLLGPHIAFAGGVAASAYAGKKKYTKNGADIVSALNGTGQPDILLVGGIFGLLGFGINYIFATLAVPTDLPGITVVVLAIITRFLFGSSGLLGKYPDGEKKVYFTMGKGLLYNILLGAGIGIAVSYVGSALVAGGASAAAMGMYPILCFGISAFSLVFTQTGFAVPATHHITLPAASAMVLSGNPLIGVAFGIVCSLLGDFFGNTFNSKCDTHIDPPATTICVIMFAVNLLFAA